MFLLTKEPEDRMDHFLLNSSGKGAGEHLARQFESPLVSLRIWVPLT